MSAGAPDPSSPPSAEPAGQNLIGLPRFTDTVIPIPGPRSLPGIGFYLKLATFFRDPVSVLTRLHERFGDIVGLTRHQASVVFAFGPEHNKLLLSDSRRFYNVERFLFPMPEGSALRRLSAGIPFMNGAQHRRHRKLMMPAFSTQALAHYFQDMVEISLDLLGRWQVGQRLDVALEMQRLTLRIACKTLFGLDASEERAATAMMFKQWLSMLTDTKVILLPFNAPGAPYRRLLNLSEELERKLKEILGEKRSNPGRETDILSLLLRAHDEEGGLSDTELIGQTNILFIAGHETTSNVLTWVLFLLSQHPNVLAELSEEVERTLRGEPPSMQAIERLTLMDGVIKETLRLLPPSSYQIRVATEPFRLGPYDMPARSVIVYSSFITHRLPQLFPEPRAFRPERWREINPSPFEFLPFGAGPRSCVGGGFATLEIKVFLSLLLQRFRLHLAPGARIDRHQKATLYSKHGMRMLLAPPGSRPTPGAFTGNIRELIDFPS